MQLTFHNPGFSYSVDSILEFQREGQSDWWRDSFFAFYPQLNRAAYDALPTEARADYLQRGLRPMYDEQQLAHKIEACDAHGRATARRSRRRWATRSDLPPSSGWTTCAPISR